MLSKRLISAMAACTLLLSAACQGPGPGAGAEATGEITVFAAASLSEAFAEVGAAFEQAYPGTRVVLNFAGTPTLRTQLEQGARADVFASANEAQMTMAVQSGVVEDGPAVFATNSLVAIAPSEGRAVLVLEHLARPGVKLVLAQSGVPAGEYAREALRLMEASGVFGIGFRERVLSNLVSEEVNVRQVVAKVALGEADAGIVYRTDVTADIAHRVGVIDIPDAFNVLAAYPVALVKDAPNPTGGAAFMAFLLSEEGRAILQAHGFGVPDDA